MRTDTSTQSERINLRLKQSAKSLIERAASFEGKTVSNFILSSALSKAEQTVQQHDVLQLNAQDAEDFFDALSKPVQLNQKLTEAFAEHDRRVHQE